MGEIKSIKVTFLVIALVAFAVSPVLAAGGGHLWFYSLDPDTIPAPAPQPLPNPEDWDPKYVGVDSDPWVTEGINFTSGDWETPFTIWLGCKQFESLGTKLVVSINNVANGIIDSIQINGTSLGSWISSQHNVLAPHGVFNSAEFYGYAEADVGDLNSPPGTPYKIAIVVDIDLEAGAEVTTDAKIHFDAYGYTDEGSLIFSPYSHDLIFRIPELGSVMLVMASFGALVLYSIKRRKL